jgi:superfamily II DNA or RNA helicase
VLTEDDLIDMAGWPVLKRARSILSSGAVQSASLKGNLLKGIVSAGKKQLSAGLLIRSQTDTDNLCTCLESKRDGQICAHTIAVALATIEGLPEKRTPVEKPKQPSKATAWQIFIPGAFPDLWQRGILPLRLAVGVTSADVPQPRPELTQLLKTLGVPETSTSPALLRLNQSQAAQFFLAATNASNIQLESPSKDPQPLRVSEIPCRLPIDITYQSGDGTITLDLNRGKTTLLVGEQTVHVFQNTSAATILRLPLPGGAPAIAELSDLFAGGRLVRPLDWLPGALPILNEAFQLTSSDGFLAKLDLTPPEPDILLELDGSLRMLAATLIFNYPERAKSADPIESITAGLTNPESERRARQRLREGGFDEKLELRGEPEILSFYASTLPRLQSEWEVTLGERFEHVTQKVQRLTPKLEPHGSGEDWFSFAINYTTDQGQTLSASEIRRLLDAGQTSTKSAGGNRIAIDTTALEDLQEVLRDTDPDQSGGDYRVSPAQADYIRSTLGEPQGKISAAPDTKITATLRPYQSEGVDWLHTRLSQPNSGAILADEMGLGKTVQTLTLICALNRKTPALVVGPTSLIHSWAAEAKKFTPHLATTVLHGSAAKRKAILSDLSGTDLLLTSYGALVRDLELHQQNEYSIVVLDEASYIKNPDTKIAKAARALAANAGARLALTGTPIENSVRDLWSIMEFALPRYLGTREDFRQRYELPIAASAKPELSRLRRRLAPFLLRRTKRAVAKDLPEKIEQVLYCELSAAQRTAYETFLSKGREQIQHLLQTQGFGKARMSILTTLLRLRQTCCHLRLIDEKSEASSGKLEALQELLQEAIEGGHRVLIFSQFVKMLGLIRDSLDAQKLSYAYLDGSTPAEQRAAQVKEFQSDQGPPIFLISLKAGGYGLTLTRADTVIHFDPWWNPAVENQATDRAHRIGQKNPVTAYKLITTGTIEERILSLQNKKRNIIETALEDESPMMSGLNENDIREILA